MGEYSVKNRNRLEIIYEFNNDEWYLLERFIKRYSNRLTVFQYDDINEYLAKHRKDRIISNERELYLLTNVMAYLEDNDISYNKIRKNKREISQNEKKLEIDEIENLKKIISVLNTIYFEKLVNEERESQDECQ